MVALVVCLFVVVVVVVVVVLNRCLRSPVGSNDPRSLETSTCGQLMRRPE